jgi:hypothetical protein
MKHWGMKEQKRHKLEEHCSDWEWKKTLIYTVLTKFSFLKILHKIRLKLTSCSEAIA